MHHDLVDSAPVGEVGDQADLGGDLRADDARDRVDRLAGALVRRPVPVPSLEHVGERLEHCGGEPGITEI